MRGADVAATVAFVPRTPRAVWHLKLIVKEEREGWVLQGEKQQSWALELCLEYSREYIHTKMYTHASFSFKSNENVECKMVAQG